MNFIKKIINDPLVSLFLRYCFVFFMRFLTFIKVLALDFLKMGLMVVVFVVVLILLLGLE